MSRYQRQHPGPNISPFVFWVLVALAIGFMIWRMDRCRQNAEALHKAETGQPAG